MIWKLIMKLPKKVRDYIRIRINILNCRIELMDATLEYNNDPTEYNKMIMDSYSNFLHDLIYCKERGR